MENKWFEATIKYVRYFDGNDKKVTEKYLVEADDISDVKSRLLDVLCPIIEGEASVSSIKHENYDSVSQSEKLGDDYFYSVVYKTEICDEKGRDKIVSSNVLVQASSFDNAYEMFLNNFNGFEITNIDLTKIIEVIRK